MNLNQIVEEENIKCDSRKLKHIKEEIRTTSIHRINELREIYKEQYTLHNEEVVDSVFDFMIENV